MSARRSRHPIYDLHGPRGDLLVKPEDVPAKLAELDAAWAHGASLRARGERVPRPDWCGGADLEVNHDRARDLRQRYGVEFEVPIPKETSETQGVLFVARVKCHANALPTGVICRDCKDLEEGNWKWLRSRLAQAARDARAKSRSAREELG